MIVKGLKCPHCDAPITLDVGDRTEINCPYCSGKIYLDDEVSRSEYKEERTLNINHVDAAKVQDAYNRRLMIKTSAATMVAMLVLALIVVIIGYSTRKTKSVALPDNSISISFQNAILGKADEAMSLIVLEQDISVTSTITREGLFNWGALQKNKEVTYTGNAIYTVNLKELREHDIVVDSERKTVTIYAPDTEVYDIIIDPSNFKMGDTSKGWLSFGDIKFTLEEAFYLESEAINLIEEKAKSDSQIEKAEKASEKALKDLFTKTVAGVDRDYKLIIKTNN